MDPGAALYHCGNNSETCFKFTNEQTGQEVVYLDGEITNDVAILGTYNYGGSSDIAHVLEDMSPYSNLANTRNDTTPWLDRLHPSLDTLLGVDDLGGIDGEPIGIIAPALPENPMTGGN